jgi:hypothetical protein
MAQIDKCMDARMLDAETEIERLKATVRFLFGRGNGRVGNGAIDEEGRDIAMGILDGSLDLGGYALPSVSERVTPHGCNECHAPITVTFEAPVQVDDLTFIPITARCPGCGAGGRVGRADLALGVDATEAEKNKAADVLGEAFQNAQEDYGQATGCGG